MVNYHVTVGMKSINPSNATHTYICIMCICNLTNNTNLENHVSIYVREMVKFIEGRDWLDILI